MLFLRYESFRGYIQLYPVTSIILLINIVLFVFMTLSGGSTNTDVLLRYGAMVSGGEIWRFVSAIFLHIGFQHLLFNCFAIFIFAPPLELMLGKVKYSIFYLGSGIVGNWLSDVVAVEVYVSAGASGAIYGIYAAFIYMSIFRKDLLDQDSSKTIAIILAIGVIYSLVIPYVNLYAHLGGFLGGVILFHFMQRK